VVAKPLSSLYYKVNKVTITISVITHSIAPVNLHSSP